MAYDDKITKLKSEKKVSIAASENQGLRCSKSSYKSEFSEGFNKKQMSEEEEEEP